MSVSKTEEKQCCVIQIIKDAGDVNKLSYITVYITLEAATGCVLDFCVLTRAT